MKRLELRLEKLEFQRLYTPNAFREERILWRSVIQLNLVRSVRAVLDAVAADAAAAQALQNTSNAPSRSGRTLNKTARLLQQGKFLSILNTNSVRLPFWHRY